MIFDTTMIAKRLECRHQGVGTLCCSAPVFRRSPGLSRTAWERKRRNTAHSKRFARFGCGFAKLRSILFFLVVALAIVPAASAATHAGPLFDDFDLTLSLGHRTEAAGPFFYSEEKDTLRTWAVPPLFSHAQDDSTDYEEFDFLYPILTYDRYGEQRHWQFCQLINFFGGPGAQESERGQFNIFPIYFQQRSSDPNRNYTAVAPFYGHLQKHFFRDEIFFVMFPLFAETRKKDVVTDNYVFPFFHLRHGDGLNGWQLWPLAGHEHKVVTTRTNGFNEVESIGGHEKDFVLWPFFFNEHTGIGTDNPLWEQGSLLAYDIERSPKRNSTSVIWPFFSYIDNRERKYHEWQVPWPFVVIARGEGKTTTRFWPLFSQAHSASLESDFYLWPVYKYNRSHSAAAESERTRILFFLYSDSILKNLETGGSKRRVDLWPFFTHQRDFNGNSRLQVLALLEPFLHGAHKIERDYSPVWSLWRSEKNPRTHSASQSLLWNLYRRDVTPFSKQSSLFFGLFQSQSGPEGKQLRLFYIPLGKDGQKEGIKDR